MTISTLRKMARRMLPRTTLAGIYRRWAREYINSLNPEFDPDKKTILAFNHFYDQDLRALSISCDDYNFVIVDAPRLVRGAKLYFCNDVINLEAEYESESQENRQAWRIECEYILDLLQERFGLDLMLSGSDIYWWVREFIIVGHERDINTVIIDKEGTVTPLCLEAYADRIGKCAPFIADHIFVWSKRQHHYWSLSGVCDNNITILGQPRSDLFHSQRTNELCDYFPKEQPLITLFSYMDDVNIFPDLFPELGDPPDLGWQIMKQQTHDEIARLAKENPEFNFVIKTHPQQPDLSLLQKTYSRENLIVIGGATIANELILRSELIIAFQTTALIEAMFMNKNVIYTSWDENYQRLLPHCLPFHDAPGIVVADSYEKFKDVFRRFLSGDHSDFSFSDEEASQRDRYIDEYFYKPNGQVCHRFFEAVSRFIP